MGKSSDTVPGQRRYRGGKRAKKASPPHYRTISQNDDSVKAIDYQMLVTVWINRHAHSFLPGTQMIGMAGKLFSKLLKTAHASVVGADNHTENTSRSTYTQKLMATLFITASTLETT